MDAYQEEAVHTTVTDVSKCYDYMCGARCSPGSARALLLFFVTCVHDAMQQCACCAPSGGLRIQ